MTDLSSELDPALLEGRKDLIAKSMRLIHSGAYRFRPSETCLGYIEIYDPQFAEPDPPEVRLAVRVLDRQTGAQKQSGELSAAGYIRPGNALAPMLLSVPLSSLPPGPYTLEVKAARTSGEAPVVRTAEFEVVK